MKKSIQHLICLSSLTLSITLPGMTQAITPPPDLLLLPVILRIESSINGQKAAIDNIKTSAAETKTSTQTYLPYIQKIYNWLQQPIPLSTTDTSWRYTKFAEVEHGVDDIQNTMAQRMSNLMQYGEYSDVSAASGKIPQNNLKAMMSRPTEFGKGKQYSALSAASSLYAGDVYEDSDQQEAAKNFVITAAGGNIVLPAIKYPDISSSKQVSYTAYQRTMAAIQSVAAYSLIKAYTSRIPVKIKGLDVTMSQRQLLKDINTGEANKEGYWDSENSPGNKGLFERMQLFLTSFFSLNYSLNHIATQLDQVNTQLALLITQNTLLSKEAYADRLYKQATGK